MFTTETVKPDEAKNASNKKVQTESLEQIKVKSLLNKYNSKIESYIEEQLTRAGKYSSTTIKSLMNALAKEVVDLALENLVFRYAKLVDVLLTFRTSSAINEERHIYLIPVRGNKSEGNVEAINDVIARLNMLALATASLKFSSSVSKDKISFQLNLDFEHAGNPLIAIKLVEVPIPLTDSRIPRHELNRLLSISVNPITYAVDRKKLRDELRNHFERYENFISFNVYTGETKPLEILTKHLEWLAGFSQPGLHMLSMTDLVRFSDIAISDGIDELNKSNSKLNILELVSVKFFNNQLEPSYEAHNLKTCEHYSKIILITNRNQENIEKKIDEIVQSEAYQQLQYLFMYARGLKVDAILRRLKKIGKDVLDWMLLI